MSSSSSLEDEVPPMCCVVVCEQPAAGIGPHSRQPMCQHHLSGDVEQVRRLEHKLLTELQPYAAVSLDSIEGRERMFVNEIQSVSSAFADIRQCLTDCETRILQRLREAEEAVKASVQTRRDIQEFQMELAQANAVGDVKEVFGLVMSMELSLGSLREDFRRVEELPMDAGEQIVNEGMQELLSSTEKHVHILQERIKSCKNVSAGSIDCSLTKSNAVQNVVNGQDHLNAFIPTLSSIIMFDSSVMWVASCSDTQGFFGDSSGRVVSAESAGDGCMPLPQPALFVVLQGFKIDHLAVTSVDGTQIFQCHCPAVDESIVWGLYCHGQKLFIAQADAVTVTDLSGRVTRKISSDVIGNGMRITGISGNAGMVYLCASNSIATVNAVTGELEKCHGSIFTVSRTKMHKVRTESSEIIVTYPTQRTGFQSFKHLWCVVVDSKGRIFVSDGEAHSVYAMADDGTVLAVIGSPGEEGCAADRLSHPYGLTLVTGGAREKLVVADWGNERLLVFDL